MNDLNELLAQLRATKELDHHDRTNHRLTTLEVSLREIPRQSDLLSLEGRFSAKQLESEARTKRDVEGLGTKVASLGEKLGEMQRDVDEKVEGLSADVDKLANALAAQSLTLQQLNATMLDTRKMMMRGGLGVAGLLVTLTGPEGLRALSHIWGG